MIKDSTLLNSNEAAPSTPSAQPTPTLPLRSLQEILHNRILQKKGEINESHNRVYNDNIWREIETLQSVLGESYYQKPTRAGWTILLLINNKLLVKLTKQNKALLATFDSIKISVCKYVLA